MKFGLLGARLGHSLSPQIHQEVFRQLGIEATYELIEVPTEKLADKVAGLYCSRGQGYRRGKYGSV